MELDMNKKVEIKNLCPWDLYFSRIEESGDVHIPALKSKKISREEILSQVNHSNVMFIGTDGKGTNARIYIDDKDTRVFLDFESEDGNDEQFVLTDDEINRILGLKTLSSFKDNIQEKVVTEAQKALLLKVARENKSLNDFTKITFIEEYTGKKYQA